MQITPTQFLESVNAINELLISAHSLKHSVLDNVLAVFTLQLSRLVKTPHFNKVCLLLLLFSISVPDRHYSVRLSGVGIIVAQKLDLHDDH